MIDYCFEHSTNLEEVYLVELSDLILHQPFLTIEDFQMRLVFFYNLLEDCQRKTFKPTFLEGLKNLIAQTRKMILTFLRRSDSLEKEKMWPLFEKILALPGIQVDFLGYALAKLRGVLKQESLQDDTRPVVEKLEHQVSVFLSDEKIHSSNIMNQAKKMLISLDDRLLFQLEDAILTILEVCQLADVEEIRSKAKITGAGLGFFLIDQKLARSIVSRNEKGETLKTNIKGSSCVSHINGLFFKSIPESNSLGENIHPEREFALMSIYHLLKETGTSLTLLLKLDGVRSVDSAEEKVSGTVLQVSLGVEGMSFDSFLEIQRAYLTLKKLADVVSDFQQEFAYILNEQYVSDFLDDNPGLPPSFAEPQRKSSSNEQAVQLFEYFETLATKKQPEQRLEEFQELTSPIPKDKTIRILKKSGMANSIRVLAIIEKYPQLLQLYRMEKSKKTADFEEILELIQQIDKIRDLFAGFSADSIIVEMESLPGKCCFSNFSAHVLASILTNPGDHHCDNLLVTFDRDDQSKRINETRIIGIDNDILFCPTVSRKQYVNVKTVIYLMNEWMCHAIDHSIFKIFLSYSPEEFVMKWIACLRDQNRRYEKLLMTGVISVEELKKAQDGSFIPMKLDPIVVFVLYEKVKKIHKLFSDSQCTHGQSPLSHWDLLESIQPILYHIYKQVCLEYDSPKQGFIDCIQTTKTIDKILKREGNSINSVHDLPPMLDEEVFELPVSLLKYGSESSQEIDTIVNMFLKDSAFPSLTLQKQITIMGLVHRSFPELQGIVLFHSSPNSMEEYFFSAIKFHYLALLKKILEEEERVSVSPNSMRLSMRKNREGNTGFLLACSKLDLEMAQILILRGSDPLARNEANQTALLLIIKQFVDFPREVYTMVRSLAPYFRDIWNATDEEFVKPLHFLLSGVRVEKAVGLRLIELFLKQGADPDQVNTNGETALDVCIRKESDQVIPQLLAFGACKISRFKETIEYFNSRPQLSEEFEKLTSINLLLRWHRSIASFSGFVVSSRHLYKILSLSEQFSEKLFPPPRGDSSDDQLAPLRVTKFVEERGMCFRLQNFPELPGNEVAFRLLFQQINASGVCVSDLIRIANSSGSVCPMMVSQVISQDTLADVLDDERKKTWINGIDGEEFSELFLTSLLVNFENATPEDFTLEKLGLRYRLLMNRVGRNFILDKFFLPGEGSRPRFPKSILFCLDQMDSTIGKRARGKFLALDPEKVLESWLRELKVWQSSVFQMFSVSEVKELFKRRKEQTVVLAIFAPKIVSDMFRKLLHIITFLKANPTPCCMDLLCEIHPELGSQYKSAFDKFHSPLDRFKNVFGDEGERSVLPFKDFLRAANIDRHTLFDSEESLVDLALKELKQAKDELTKSIQEISIIQKSLTQGEIERFENLQFDLVRQKVVNGIPGHLFPIDLEKTPSRSLKAIAASPFGALTLLRMSQKSYSTLFKQLLTKSPNLSVLELVECSCNGEALFSSISKSAHSLKKLVIRDFSHAPIALTEIRDFSHPSIEEIQLSQMMALDSITAKVPQLRSLSLSNCPLLSKILLPKTLFLSSFRVSSCPRIDLWEGKPREKMKQLLHDHPTLQLGHIFLDPATNWRQVDLFLESVFSGGQERPANLCQKESILSLCELDFSRKNINQLVPEIGCFVSIQRLVLNENMISLIPPEIASLIFLEELEANFNRIQTLPPDIKNLLCLRKFSLSSNNFQFFPVEVCQLVSLQELNLNLNKISAISPRIRYLTRLKSLDLSFNKLTSLPPEIGNLSNLEILKLSGNSITLLPPEIGSLQHLRSLFLAENLVQVLPSEIQNLSRLHTLKLCSNGLSAFPPQLGQLSNLRSLSAANNRISALPVSFGNLVQLEELSLLRNHLSVLPPEMCNLTNLKQLNLHQNRLLSEYLDRSHPTYSGMINCQRIDL